jgi:hypothetical protein
MTDQETTLLIQDIISNALEGNAFTFKPIVYWSEFIFYHKCVISTKIVIKTLKRATKKLFKEYCRDVITGISDITKLLAYQQLLSVTDFYKNDLITIQLMLDEYDEYLGNFGNFIRALLGEQREL